MKSRAKANGHAKYVTMTKVINYPLEPVNKSESSPWTCAGVMVIDIGTLLYLP